MTGTQRDVRELVREEHAMRAPILAALADGPLSVPELAERLGYPGREVMFWIMGMRRYGYIAEVPGADDEGYFRYRATDRQATR